MPETRRGALSWAAVWLLGYGLMAGCASLDRTPIRQGEPFTNCIGMELAWIPAGYWVGKYEVTQEQYLRVMHLDPSRWKGARRPVENVDSRDAAEFCARLTAMDAAAKVPLGNLVYSLPTEKQWEGFVADARIEDMVHGCWKGLTPLGTMPVGSLGPNTHGLHDVRGNVWEWCSDWWDAKKNERVLRGGAWDLVNAEDLDASYRPVSAAVGRDGNIGFRVVLRERRPGEGD